MFTSRFGPPPPSRKPSSASRRLPKASTPATASNPAPTPWAVGRQGPRGRQARQGRRHEEVQLRRLPPEAQRHQHLRLQEVHELLLQRASVPERHHCSSSQTQVRAQDRARQGLRLQSHRVGRRQGGAGRRVKEQQAVDGLCGRLGGLARRRRGACRPPTRPSSSRPVRLRLRLRGGRVRAPRPPDGRRGRGLRARAAVDAVPDRRRRRRRRRGALVAEDQGRRVARGLAEHLAAQAGVEIRLLETFGARSTASSPRSRLRRARRASARPRRSTASRRSPRVGQAPCRR